MAPFSPRQSRRLAVKLTVLEEIDRQGPSESFVSKNRVLTNHTASFIRAILACSISQLILDLSKQELRMHELRTPHSPLRSLRRCYTTCEEVKPFAFGVGDPCGLRIPVRGARSAGGRGFSSLQNKPLYPPAVASGVLRSYCRGTSLIRRVASLIRSSTPLWDHHRTLGAVLLYM